MTYQYNEPVWTPTACQELRQRWQSGESASTIACAMRWRVSREAVLGKVRRLGLSNDPGRPRPRHANVVRLPMTMVIDTPPQPVTLPRVMWLERASV